ncbi:capsid maturation protease [Mycobacterium phage Dixon]|nr:capsid maturation protease [Mycobacterium phage Dixon]QHB36903.1 capsid maturation protease [Mycobacterium phage Roary]
MTPEQFAEAMKAITSALGRRILGITRLFLKNQLSQREWLQVLELLYPEVEYRRSEAASLARTFYDAQRFQQVPDLPRNDRPLEEYRFEWFVQNMEPARKLMSKMDSASSAAAHVTLRAVREVENAARRQVIHAVENDFDLQEFIEAAGRPAPRLRAVQQDSQLIRGWAREATGDETCAWCLMLISRGPVYIAAETAGLDLDDDEAARMIAAGEDVSEHMAQWHTGCDCKVVPVFKYGEWHGKAAADRALDLWNDASREATRLIESGKARSSNHNREAINALRRRLERGEINPREFAALAA